MKVIVKKILRKGKKSARIQLSTGETIVVDLEALPNVGDVYSETTSDDSVSLRLLRPTDPYPSILKFN